LLSNIVILTDSVIHVEPVFGSPLVVHLVGLRLGNNPAMIATNFEFSGCEKEELVERERKNDEDAGEHEERSHSWTFRGRALGWLIFREKEI
jgi:hypothetical protein